MRTTAASSGSQSRHRCRAPAVGLGRDPPGDGGREALPPRVGEGRDVVDVGGTVEHQERGEGHDGPVCVADPEPPLAAGREDLALDRLQLRDRVAWVCPEEGERIAHAAPQLRAVVELLHADRGRDDGRLGRVRVHHEVPPEPVAARRELGEEPPVGLMVEGHQVHHVGAHACEGGQQGPLHLRGTKAWVADVDPRVVRVPDPWEAPVGDDSAPGRRLDVGEQVVERAPEPVDVVGDRHGAGTLAAHVEGTLRRDDRGARVPGRPDRRRSGRPGAGWADPPRAGNVRVARRRRSDRARSRRRRRHVRPSPGHGRRRPPPPAAAEGGALREVRLHGIAAARRRSHRRGAAARGPRVRRASVPRDVPLRTRPVPDRPIAGAVGATARSSSPGTGAGSRPGR